MGRECKYHAHFTLRAARDMIDIKQQSLFNEGMDTEFELERVKKKSKDKELTRLF